MENIDEKRREERTNAELSSVEFCVNTFALAYQFKILETSPSGMSILIKEDSAILNHLKEGMMLEMKYYPENEAEAPKILKTRIMHITKSDSNRLKGHYQVGIQLLENFKE
ncbi:MAG: hypothetical protein JXL81_11340 [Deltaproteobacteria bacterium]|nr:hypothetical protein [Deltaproteobacteria bacterium]